MHATLILLLLQTPNIGGLFPRRPTLSDPETLARAMTQYQRDERDLFARRKLTSGPIVAHWRELRTLRRAADRLVARKTFARISAAERAKLGRALNGLVDHAMDLVYVGVDQLDPRIVQADEERTRELLRLALLGNRWFGL